MASTNGQHDRRAGGRAEHRADLVIVGAGAIGLACAWRSARAGLTVCVVDDGRAGAASPVAAGMLAPAGEAQWGQEDVVEACLASGRLWPEFAAELEGEADQGVGFERCGALHVALDRDEAAELKRRLPLIRGGDADAGWCLPSRCREIEPGLAPGAGPGVLIPGEAVVDPRALLTALRSAARSRGVTLLEGEEPAELLFEDGRCAGLRLASGARVDAGSVLVAAGAWSASLPWVPRQAAPALRPVKGEILRLRSGARLAQRIVHTERVYVVSRPGGEVVVGATMEDTGFEVSASAGAVHELLREAYRALPDVAECEFVEVAAGLRPATPDGAPYVGQTATAGLYLACGHFRNGILLAPLTAEAIVTAVTGTEPPPAAASLAPAAGRMATEVGT